MSAGAKRLRSSQTPFEDIGENVFHIGPIGSGHTLKLINNFFAMTTACAMSEAFAMADLAGLDRQTLYDVMASGPLHSGMMDWVKAEAIDGIPDQLAFRSPMAARMLPLLQHGRRSRSPELHLALD